MERAFLSLLESSLTVGVIVLLLKAFTPLLNRHYAVRWKYWAWLLLAVRLLAPVSLSLPKAPVSISVPEVRMVDLRPGPVPIQTAQLPDSPSVRHTPSPSLPQGPTLLQVCMLVWLIGCLCFLIYQAAGYICYRRRILRWRRDARDASLLTLVDAIRQDHPRFRRVTLLISDAASGPLMLGFCRPLLVLPHERYTEEELHFILAHEYTHYQRRDLWYKLLLVLATAMHWFNPCAYLLLREASADLELSCDDVVMRGQDLSVRRAYSEIILTSIHRASVRHTALSTYFYGGMKAMKERFFNILTLRRRRYGLALLAGVLVAVTLAGALVGSTYAADNASDDGFAPILALRAEGYEEMTLTEYTAYLREAVSADADMFYGLLYRAQAQLGNYAISDDDAFFIRHVVMPLLAEDNRQGWQAMTYMPSDEQYVLSLDIRPSTMATTKITVGQYRAFLRSVVEKLEAMIASLASPEAAMETEFSDHIRSVITDVRNEAGLDGLLELEVGLSRPNSDVGWPDTQAATQSDYDAILTFRPEGYQDMSVQDFGQAWDDYISEKDLTETYQRIVSERPADARPTGLTDEDWLYLRYTLAASSVERISRNYEKALAFPTFTYLFEGATDQSIPWLLSAIVRYDIRDTDTFTVGERDARLMEYESRMRQNVPTVLAEAESQDEANALLQTMLELLCAELSDGEIALSLTTLDYCEFDISDGGDGIPIPTDEDFAALLGALQKPGYRDMNVAFFDMELEPYYNTFRGAFDNGMAAGNAFMQTLLYASQDSISLLLYHGEPSMLSFDAACPNGTTVTYTLTWSIADPRVTIVGERDDALNSTRARVQTIIDGMEDAAPDTPGAWDALTDAFEALSTELSNEAITLDIGLKTLR